MSRDMTPSPSAIVQTPPAPRYGFHDKYQPFRASRPLAAPATSDEARSRSRTPSPSASCRQSRPLAPPNISGPTLLQSMARMASPEPSPLKRRHPPSESVCPSAMDPLSSESGAKVGASLALQQATALSMEGKKSYSSTLQSMTMLPTPAKTPHKQVYDEKEARIHEFAARKLFQPRGLRKRRPIKYEMAASENEEMEIFTDQEDAIPTKDLSLDNPFYGKKMSPRTINRGQGNMVSVPGEGSQPIEEVAKRTDGMIFVFRGKKIFRKFSDCQSDQETSDSEYDSQSVNAPKSPLKPRVLFPPKERNEEEEEAVTDVEDMYSDEEYEEEAENLEPPKTPVKFNAIQLKTPDAPKFAPVSPPPTKQTTTKRTTRSTGKLDSKSSTRGSKDGRNSPFDSWQRTKENKGLPLEKRQGEGLAQVTTKRSRA